MNTTLETGTLYCHVLKVPAKGKVDFPIPGITATGSWTNVGGFPNAIITIPVVLLVILTEFGLGELMEKCSATNAMDFE